MALTCRAVGGIPLLMIRVTVREGKETALTVMWSLGRSGETQRLYEKGRPKNVAGKLRWAKENVISTSDCQPLDGCPSRIPIENLLDNLDSRPNDCLFNCAAAFAHFLHCLREFFVDDSLLARGYSRTIGEKNSELRTTAASCKNKQASSTEPACCQAIC